MVEIEVAFDPGQYMQGELEEEAETTLIDDNGTPLDESDDITYVIEDDVALEDNGGKLLIGLAITEPIPGLNAEVYYYQSGSGMGGSGVDMDELDQGVIIFDVGYSMEMDDFGLEAGAGLGYLLEDVGDDGTNLMYGVGLAATYSIATLTVGLDGNNQDALNGLTATVEVAPIDLISIYGGIALALNETATNAEQTFQDADLGICIALGAAEIKIGYLVTELGAEGFNAPAAIDEGGVYIKCDIDY
jgi:hypothetical protein